MPNLSLNVNYRRPIGPARWKGIEGLRNVIDFLQAVASGRREVDAVKLRWNDDVTLQAAGSYGGQAAAMVLMASSSGAVGATLGGTAVTVTWATSDTLSSTALAAAIRANATVGQFLTATNKLMQLTCATVLAGDSVKVLEQTFTAIANGGTVRKDGDFSIGGSDTACALALATAINRHPSLAGRCRAVSVAGVVYIGLVDDRTPLPIDAIRSPSSTTIAVNVAKPVAGARTMVLAGVPGIIGNFVTIVASGTNVSVLTNGTAGQLGQGSGGALSAFTEDIVP